MIFQTFSIKGLAIITFERERERGGGVGRANIFWVKLLLKENDLNKFMHEKYVLRFFYLSFMYNLLPTNTIEVFKSSNIRL